MNLKVMQGHKRQKKKKNHFRTFVYGPIFMKIFMNANIIQMQFFHKTKNDLRGH